MLEMRPNCESCDTDLPAHAPGAMICSFECTFCADCAETRFGGICPNCGGGLAPRPARPIGMLERYPPSSARVRRSDRPS